MIKILLEPMKNGNKFLQLSQFSGMVVICDKHGRVLSPKNVPQILHKSRNFSLFKLLELRGIEFSDAEILWILSVKEFKLELLTRNR